ncbi:hypothetical protein [Bacillus cereus group sp. BfR-BA-01538]|uniref:RICIN domain-containing protein n=1 Tax=Bacillus cereus group sp. BfR-BA-01538 TaxID=2920373 RepID=UPI001F564B0C
MNQFSEIKERDLPERFRFMTNNQLVINAEKNNNSFVDSKLQLKPAAVANNSLWGLEERQIELAVGMKASVYTIYNLNGSKDEVVTYLPDNSLVMKKFNGDRANLWFVASAGAGRYIIQSVDDLCLAFTVKDGLFVDGGQILVANNSGNSNQLWAIPEMVPLQGEIQNSHIFNKWYGERNAIDNYVIRGVYFNDITSNVLDYIERYKLEFVYKSLVQEAVFERDLDDILKVIGTQDIECEMDDKVKLWAIDVTGRETLVLDKTVKTHSDPISG